MSAVTLDTISILPIRTPALGDTSYVVSDGDVAVVVDPQRDIQRFEGRPRTRSTQRRPDDRARCGRSDLPE